MSRWMERVDYFAIQERCVRCGKQDAYTMYGGKRCFECVEKGREYQAEYNQKNRKEHNEKMHERYQRLKAEGICVQCGKRKAVFGVKCEGCRIKFNNYQMNRLKEG